MLSQRTATTGQSRPVPPIKQTGPVLVRPPVRMGEIDDWEREHYKSTDAEGQKNWESIFNITGSSSLMYPTTGGT